MIVDETVLLLEVALFAMVAWRAWMLRYAYTREDWWGVGAEVMVLGALGVFALGVAVLGHLTRH